MVLSEEPCEKGKDCKASECTKSRVSPAAVLANTQDPVDFSASTRTVLTLHVPPAREREWEPYPSTSCYRGQRRQRHG
jgi:hypothetical protein